MRHSVSKLLVAASVALLGVLLGGCQATLFTAINASAHDKGVRADTDIVFDSNHDLKLDVYAMPGTKAAPVVVFFYGGNWNSGKRQ